MVPIQGLAGVPQGKDRHWSIRIELSPRALVILVLLVPGPWMLNQLLPVILVLVAALIIVGTINPAVRWLEERRMRRDLGIAIDFAGPVVAKTVDLRLSSE